MIGDTTWEDCGFQADWLVIDIFSNKGGKLDIPPVSHWWNPERSTMIMPGTLRDGRYYRRWEL